jgi:hypothetical protein
LAKGDEEQVLRVNKANFDLPSYLEVISLLKELAKNYLNILFRS